jgi:hypothetical protein
LQEGIGELERSSRSVTNSTAFYPAEQARILRLLIERIDVASDGISVTLHAAGIRSIVAELASEEAGAPDPRHEAMLEAAE